MPKSTKLTKPQDEYNSILADLTELLEKSRRLTARSINAIMTATYWEIGRRIVEIEQGGEGRAEYGEEFLVRLAGDLSKQFGRGFKKSNLYQMRSFYLSYKNIFQTLSGKSQKIEKTGFTQSFNLKDIAKHFPLPWSHYVRLSSVKNENARDFYEKEALRGGWTVRQLNRQIGSNTKQIYQMTTF